MDINRNTVEFKGQSSKTCSHIISHINRNTVEFKDPFIYVDRLCQTDINRITVEFKDGSSAKALKDAKAY